MLCVHFFPPSRAGKDCPSPSKIIANSLAPSIGLPATLLPYGLWWPELLKHSKTTALQINWWLKKRDVWTKNHLTKKRRKGYNGLWNQEVKLFKAGSTVTLLSASKQDLTSLKKQLWYIAELPLIVALHDWLQKQTMNEVKANQGDLASWGEMRPWC